MRAPGWATRTTTRLGAQTPGARTTRFGRTRTPPVVRATCLAHGFPPCDHLRTSVPHVHRRVVGDDQPPRPLRRLPGELIEREGFYQVVLVAPLAIALIVTAVVALVSWGPVRLMRPGHTPASYLPGTSRELGR